MGYIVSLDGKTYDIPDEFRDKSKEEKITYIESKLQEKLTTASVAKDMAQQVVSGTNRGVLNTAEAVLSDIPNIGGKLIPGAVIDVANKIPPLKAAAQMFGEIPKLLNKLEYKITTPAKTTAGRITGGIAQFALPYTAVSKVTSSMGYAKGFKKAIADGAITSFSVLDPHEDRLANFLTSLENPLLNNTITKFLAAKKDDSAIEGRIKNILEDMLLGSIAESTIRTLKVIKGGLKAKEVYKTPLKLHPGIDDVPKDTINFKPVLGDPKVSLAPIDKVMSTEFTKQITDAAEDILKGKPDKLKALAEGKTRVSRELVDLITAGELQPQALKDVLTKYDITPAELAIELQHTWSSAGRTLGTLSGLYKKLQKEFASDKEAMAVLEGFKKDKTLEGLIRNNSGWDLTMALWSRMENLRRAMIVTQLGTAVRNITTQVARAGIADVDEAFQAVLKGTFNKGRAALKGKEAFKSAVGPFDELGYVTFNYSTMVRRLSPKHRKSLDDFLETKSGAMAKARLLYTPVHEIQTLGKVADTFNIINRAQEIYTRKLAFEAKLTSILKSKGMKLTDFDPKKLTQKDINEAINFSLDMSFANSPKSKGGRDLINAWNKIPGLTLINPFPRFHFANALPFIKNHSPLRMLSKSSWQKILAGNTDEAADMISKTMIGSSMLVGAWNLDERYGGDKWYEWKIGKDERGHDKIVDMRSYAPLTTPLLIVSSIKDHIKGTNKVKPKEYARFIFGLNRLAGTGFEVFNWVNTESKEAMDKSFARMASSWLGSWSVPLRTFKDLYAGVSAEESIIRYTKSDPILGSFVGNIPIISQELPEGFSPYTIDKRLPPSDEFNINDYARIETQRDKMTIGIFDNVPAPIVKQIFGLSFRTKSPVESEVNRLNISAKTIYPRTSVTEASRLIIGYTGVFAESVIKPTLESAKYLNAPDSVKKVLLKKLYASAKMFATGQLAARHTTTFVQMRKEDLDKDVKQISEDLGIPVGKAFDNIIQKLNQQEQEKAQQ